MRSGACCPERPQNTPKVRHLLVTLGCCPSLLSPASVSQLSPAFSPNLSQTQLFQDTPPNTHVHTCTHPHLQTQACTRAHTHPHPHTPHRQAAARLVGRGGHALCAASAALAVGHICQTAWPKVPPPCESPPWVSPALCRSPGRGEVALLGGGSWDRLPSSLRRQGQSWSCANSHPAILAKDVLSWRAALWRFISGRTRDGPATFCAPGGVDPRHGGRGDDGSDAGTFPNHTQSHLDGAQGWLRR